MTACLKVLGLIPGSVVLLLSFCLRFSVAACGLGIVPG